MITLISILADIDDQIEAYDNSIRDRIEKWIKEKYIADDIKISDKPNEDGLYEVSAGEVILKNTNLEYLTNNMFVWKNVENFFFCNCLKLKSLEGAPEVSGKYYCTNCYSLNANGIPDEIREKVVFNCEGCKKSGLSVFWDFTFGDENEARPYVKITNEYDCATPEFVEKVKDVYLNKVQSSISDMVNSHWLIKYLICIIKNIPIHFGKQIDYKDYDDGKYLGLYRRNKDNTREIILFKDAIKAEAKGDNEYLENLIWKVIIHEYAHAMMDTLQDDKIKTQDPKLYKYREESLANAFALKVLKSSRSGFSKIEDFVKSQPEEYRHGLDLYESEDLLEMMESWREMKIEGNKRF